MTQAQADDKKPQPSKDKAILPHEQRVVEELAQLHERMEKLSGFLYSDRVLALPAIDLELLHIQQAQMEALALTLKLRVARFGKAGGGQ